MLHFLMPRRAPPPRTARDHYLHNLRAYYRAATPRPRPRSRKQARHTPQRRLALLLYAVVVLVLVLQLSPRIRRLRHPSVAFTAVPTPATSPTVPSLSSATSPVSPLSPVSAVSAAEAAATASAAGRPPAMRPPQFGGAYAPAAPVAASSLRALDDAMRAASDEDDGDALRADIDADPVAPPLPPAPQRAWSSYARREPARNPAHAFRPAPPPDVYTRTCHHSSRTGDALCVHAPFCVRHNAIVYMSDSLTCAPYSNKQGKLGTLSMGRCVELERDVEALGDIEQVEHKPSSWLQSLQHDNKILWFEGDTIFVRMSARCKSVVRFAERVFLLHHVLQHPERYSMGAISNVVIAADEDVARKIRYSKSWHHGLLAAAVHPNKLIYSMRTIRDLVTELPADPSEIRVFIPAGLWDLAKGRLVPCFRRAAITAASRSQFFLSEDVFPGVVDIDSISSPTRFRDADVFRTLLFQSLGHPAPPSVTKQLLYLHRASTRTLTDSGLSILEAKLREVAQQNGFAYRLLDVAGLTFPQQIEAVAGAGVVVGVHGTQMLNTLFLPAGAAIVEIFPYGYSNKLFDGGSGAGLHYARHQILHGEDFPQQSKFQGLDNCLHVSKDCRRWYQSDERKLDFGLLDAAAVGSFVQEGIVHVEQSL